jgi:pimeloyl-ACP methyl ester carboxylesterase
MTLPTLQTTPIAMRNLSRLLALLLAAAGLSLAGGAATPAGACAAGPDDPCLHDPNLMVITGHVSEDATAHGGERRPGEGGVAGVKVWLDYNGSSQPEAWLEPVTKTDADGNYRLEVDAADMTGTPWKLRVRIATGHFDDCITPNPCVTEVPYEPGTTRDAVDFAVSTQGFLEGHVYEDRNEDARRQDDEPPLFTKDYRSGIVYMDADNDGKRQPDEPQSTIGPAGQWAFTIPTQLLGRAVHLRLEEVRGWACTAPKSCEDILPPFQSGDRRNVGGWMVALPIVVFVHGYLGSQIDCLDGSRNLWLKLPRADLAGMLLDDDGRTNLSRAKGGDFCTESAGPNGNLLRTVVGADIYGQAEDHYASLTLPERFKAIAWDWRKDPTSQVEALDRVIDRLRCGGERLVCDEPVANKVVLVAHSQGGLLSRAYIADPEHAAKVRRLVTIGTPTWGSPKAIFPITAGIETPLGSPMDLFLDNDNLRKAARNLAGGIALLPARPYGPWFTADPWRQGAQGPDGVADFLDAIGANGLLARQATRNHDQIWDSYNNGSLNGVDYQVVVGRGVPTIQTVGFEYGVRQRVKVTFGPGDQTVPERSAAFDAPADKVHYVCGVGHIPLTAAIETTSMIDRWIQNGSPVRDHPDLTDCPVDGTVTQIIDAARPDDVLSPLNFSLPEVTAGAAKAPAPARASAARMRVRAAAADGGAMTLRDAESRGLVDVMAFGGQTFVVSDDRHPVTFTVPADKATVITRSIDGTKEGPERRYGPLSGSVTVTTGGEAAVRQGSRRLTPAKADRQAPRTTARIRRLAHARVRLTLKASDASPTTTYLVVGKKKRKVRSSVVLSAKDAKRARYASVDVWGNQERLRRLARR